MFETGRCVAGKYWALNVNADEDYILKVANVINSLTSPIVQVYNCVEHDLNRIALSQRITSLTKCNILIIAPENFEEEVMNAIGYLKYE